MTVAELIAPLQKMPADSKAVFYDSEYMEYHEIVRVAPKLSGVELRPNGNGDKVYEWKEYDPTEQYDRVENIVHLKASYDA